MKTMQNDKMDLNKWMMEIPNDLPPFDFFLFPQMKNGL